MQNKKFNHISDIENLAIPPTEITELDLTEFDFAANTLGDVLSKCPGLLSLDLSDTSIHQDDLLYLENTPLLEKLDISGTRVNNLSAIAKLINLKSLTAYDTEISDLSPLKSSPLVQLEIGRAKINDLSSLGAVKALQVLNLQGNSGITSLSGLCSLKNLVSLDVKGASVDANELAHLEELPKLVQLYVNVDIEFAAKAVLERITRVYRQSKSAFFQVAAPISSVIETELENKLV